MNEPVREPLTHWSLVRRLADPDDSGAWEEFSATYGRVIHRFSMSAGLSHHEAQEAVQEITIEVLQKMQAGDFVADPAAGSFRGWLFRLVRWRTANLIEKRGRYERRLVRSGPLDQDRPSNPGLENQVPDPSGNLCEAAWDAEWENAVIARALDGLKLDVSERHFQIFYLHVIKQQSAEEVASALGVRRGTVYLVKFRLMPDFDRLVRLTRETLL